MSDECHVCDQFCAGETRAECFCCGLPVCLKCSSRRAYYNYGRVRLCNHCQIDYDESEDVVTARLAKMAGY